MKTLACHNEAARLKALRQYQILDTPPEQAFEDLVFLATQICGTPIALINLVDENRQWFKAKVGLDVDEIPIDIGFAPICMHLGKVLIIPDTLADERFAKNPVVTSYPYVRFYAGVPLMTPEEEVIGALCIADRIPRQISPGQVEALRSLSRLIVKQLDIRRNLAELTSIKTERKQVEEQLCWKEALLRTMTSVSQRAFYVVDHRTDNILYFNDRFCEIWGIEHLKEQMQRQELKNQDIIIEGLKFGVDIPVFTETCKALQSEENSCIVEDEIPLTDGRIIRRFSTQVRDENDQYFGRLYMFEDITACKQVEQQVREQAALLDIATDAITVRDLSNKILWSNKSAQKLYEWKAAEVMCNCANQLHIKGNGELLIENTSTPLSVGFERGFNPAQNEPHKSAGVSNSQRLSEILTKNGEQFVPHCSPLRVPYSLFDEPFSQEREIYNSVLEHGSWQGELQKRIKSSKEILVESHWKLVRDEHGQAKSILVVDTDITQKKYLEKQFLRAQRMESIGTLASGIAHDLNNVLSPILMSVQLLKAKCDDERSRQMLTIVENNAKRGANLVKQVLSFARGIDGDRSVLQLKHLIFEMKQIVEQTFPKSIAISTEIQPDLWHVYGDSTQLHQIMMNLFLNARDAMPKGGDLQISAKNIFIDENYARMHDEAQVGLYIVLTVSDTGVGIPHEQIERIFEPFFTTKEFDKGTGLGLSTVMGIVKSHGGFITVSSSVSEGTLFQVYLPAVQTATIQPVEELKLITGQGEWILVVDDEAAVRDITKATLENNNYKVITASDGIEAVALYAQHRDKISAAIIDMMMPGMDGETTISTLYKINPLLRIVAVSGLAISEQITDDRASKPTVFLPKPHTAQELLKTLHTIISSTRSQKSGVRSQE